MINFFRKKRKTLADEDNTLKYARYAVGEIVLVVIGILIALSINNWNENRKDKIIERQIISGLHLEFIQNKIIVNEILEVIDNSSNACYKIMGLMNKDAMHLSKYKTDSLIYMSIEYKHFNPSNNILFEVLQTGNLKIISNKALKDNLFEWSRELENNKSTFKIYGKWIEDGILPYYSKNIALKNIDKYGPLAWKKKSEFDEGIASIFKDREFENIIDNNLYHLSTLKNEYSNLKTIIEEIIDKTNSF